MTNIFEKQQIPQKEKFVKVGSKLGKEFDELILTDIDHLAVSIHGLSDTMNIDRVFVKTESGDEYLVTFKEDIGWVFIDDKDKKIYPISGETMGEGVLRVGESFGPAKTDKIAKIVGVDTTWNYSEEELKELVDKNKNL